MASALSCVICHDCDQRLRYFHVPGDPERLQSWCEILNLDINPSSIVCEKHFLNEHISRNSELNCCRLNKKAIPTLNLTGEDVGDIKLINEDDFDKRDDSKQCVMNYKTKGTQTKGFPNAETPIAINCLWCKDSFIEPDLYVILAHLKIKHQYEIESFMFFNDDEDLAPKSQFDVVVEEAEVLQDEVKIEEYSEVDVETNSLYEANSIKSAQSYYGDDGDNEVMDTTYEIEECDLNNELILKTSPTDDVEEGNIDGLLKIKAEKPENESINKMLPTGEVSHNQVNMHTSDSELILFIIDLLQSMPALWFFSSPMSKEYEAAFVEFCAKFSEKYEYFMTQVELHESLADMRDWYEKFYEQNIYDQLPYPQCEYYHSLAEFLPDKPDGKTCELCGVVFYDHLQYFAHQKLEHALPDDDNAPTVLKRLKKNAYVYFYARYPLRQSGFSYQCQICQLKRQSKREFFEHIKKHLNIREHVCDICGKTFIRVAKFLVHQKRHQGLYKGICQICGKEFTNFSLLTAHRVRYHRPIEGTIEEIERQSLLKRRNLKNVKYVPYEEGEGERFACPCCERTYKYKRNALMHYNRFHKTDMDDGRVWSQIKRVK